MQPDEQTPPLDPQQKVKRRHLWIGRVGAILGILVGITGLLLGRMGNLWIAFDIFSQLTVQFLALTTAFAVGLLLPRAKVAVSLALFVAMSTAYGVWPLLAQDDLMSARASAVASGSKPLKIMSFNTWLSNSAVDAVFDEIKRTDADVVALVEFGSDKERKLPSLKQQYPYQATCNGAPHCNFAILSKYPIASTSIKVGWEGPPLLQIMLGGDFAGLNVFAVHSIRFPHSRAQFRQMKALSALLQQTPGPKLAMGDFNATPYSRMTSIIENEADLKRLTNVPSWPSYIGVPQVAIDHIFASEGIVELQAVQLGNPSGSDHFPIRMSLAVPTSVLAAP